jgi:hypothetical protein
MAQLIELIHCNIYLELQGHIITAVCALVSMFLLLIIG